MIEEIRIRDLGVISEAVLPLGPGFTAITGETGAGKTMVVTALGLLRGERADSSAVRNGSDTAWVEGRWILAVPETITETVTDAGGLIEGDELLLGRSVSVEGRSRAVVGGRSTPVAVLGELGELLVAVHGQSDQVRLRSPAAQREALDRFAGGHFGEILGEYAHAFKRWKANAAELASITAARDARVREAEELRASISEIEALAPQPGEDEQLRALAERLTHTEDLRIATALAREALSSEVGDGADALARVDAAKRQVEKMADVDPVLAVISDTLTQLSLQLHEVTGQLSSHLANLEAEDERDLNTIQERRAELTTLMRKYGPSLEEVIALLDSGSARLFELDNDGERITELAEEVAADHALVIRGADALHELRVAAAERLSGAVTQELAALAMPDAQLFVKVTHGEDLALHGRDTVELLLRPHPGSDPRPISKSASGGELSRIMLALEVVIAGEDSVPTYVFDEVDSGVGGASAIEIGRRLARLAEKSQVIVVTHLAQVAAFATNHLRVVKDTSGDVTESSVQVLRGEAREAEMARLLSGLPDSENALAHARELIQLASGR
ncbi:DNA repair protein RecN (Recombination protein N) [Aurantimicrobium minutum]|uniref:DNA repair protein RecN n=1 Tax=Aurantimicrobium minutum TaxID=708131 RepID=UPI00247598E4|nr:DNA repair protein RecN [Aurantimicrobium minutum]MDH6532803.1 DNA repair protein RecN (Recombination protein N) [Aurantimicrobium minutum]